MTMQESKNEVECWVYLLHKYKPHMVELPYLESYSAKGDHGLEYVARYLRKKPGPEYWNDVKLEECPHS